MSETLHEIVGPARGKIGSACVCGKRFTTEVQAEAHVMDEAEKLFTQPVIIEEKKVEKEEPKTRAVATTKGTKLIPKGAPGVSAYLNKNEIKELIKDRIKDNPEPFISSIMTAVNKNELLATCTPQSILGAAIEAVGLNLSVNPNLGQMYLVPYRNNNKGGVYEAQAQVGYKGFIQLAQRSGQYKTISAVPVYKGQLVETNPVTGNVYDWTQPSEGEPIGYLAYFKLLNGFEKEWYMTQEQVMAHAQRFSQSFRKNMGPWKDHAERMKLKTPLRFLLNTYGILSVELQRAIEIDQGVIEGEVVEYPDNKPEWHDALQNAASPDEVKEILDSLPLEEQKDAAKIAESRIKELT